MGVTFSNRIIALTAGAAIAVGAQALLPQAASASAHHVRQPAHHHRHPGPGPGHAHGRAQSRTWLTGNTAGRGLRWGHGGTVADAVGKIFFTLGLTDYVCSGTLVQNRPGGIRGVDVVLTAAHCAEGAHGQWATNWTFVPGYRNGAEPYGEYTAHRFFVSPKWTGPGSASERYDVAFVQVAPATMFGRAQASTPPPGLPVRFADRPGARPGAAARPRTYVFGYPALLPFSGEYANYCAGPARLPQSGPRAGSTSISCSMTAGDSGGPWLAGFSPRRGRGAIVAVSAYKFPGGPRTLFGTVLGPAARALYRAATRVWHTIPT